METLTKLYENANKTQNFTKFYEISQNLTNDIEKAKFELERCQNLLVDDNVIYAKDNLKNVIEKLKLIESQM